MTLERWHQPETEFPGSIWERPAGFYVRLSLPKLYPASCSEHTKRANIEFKRLQDEEGFKLWDAKHDRYMSEITILKRPSPTSGYPFDNF